MKKILIAIAEKNLPEGAFEFVRRLNEINPVLVTGVFLREVVYALDPALAYYEGTGAPVFNSETKSFSQSEIKKRIDWFESLCKKNSIEYRVHNDTDDLIIHNLIKETRFADLLIVSAEAFYHLSESTEPEGYLKSILHQAECPVLVAPQKFDFPNNVILAYDGSESSVYAIKQFSYVLSEFCNKEAVVVYEGKEDTENFPEEILIHELAARHFKALRFLRINKDMFRLSSWVSKKPESMLVTGSYGRSNLSELFRKSFVADVIREHKSPVFIAHK
jgi:hypothetical protein